MRAALELTDFRVETLAPGTDRARLSVGGKCALSVRRALQGDAVPEAAMVTLLVDGEEKARETLDLSREFSAPGQTSGDDAQMSASSSLAVTYYIDFDRLELPLPDGGAVLVADVTDSAGHQITVLQNVYLPRESP